MSEFDGFAHEYEAGLERGLGLAGESAEYFSRARVAFLVSQLRRRHEHGRMRRILDFGCGLGDTTRELCRAFPCTSVIGVDRSEAMLDRARRQNHHPLLSFARVDVDDELPQGFQLIYVANVFHHVPGPCREQLLRRIERALEPGGILAFFENNPWNPGARAVMARVPFDRDAEPLSVLEARRLLNGAGLKVAATRSLFYFPRCLASWRWIEPFLGSLPLGAQYALLARKSLARGPGYSMTRTGSFGASSMALGTPP